MQPSLLRTLRCRRWSVRARWEALLRAEPVATPLGLPDTLIHLMDTTLAELFDVLENPRSSRRSHQGRTASGKPVFCPCGRNPLLAYFAAAGQALREGLVLARAASAPSDPGEREAALDELNDALQEISRREIEAFCGVCQYRHRLPPAIGPALCPRRRRALSLRQKGALPPQPSLLPQGAWR